MAEQYNPDDEPNIARQIFDSWYDVRNGSIYPEEDSAPDSVEELKIMLEWEDLLAQSSLGTPAATRLQERTREGIRRRRADILFRDIVNFYEEDGPEIS